MYSLANANLLVLFFLLMCDFLLGTLAEYPPLFKSLRMVLEDYIFVVNFGSFLIILSIILFSLVVSF